MKQGFYEKQTPSFYSVKKTRAFHDLDFFPISFEYTGMQPSCCKLHLTYTVALFLVGLLLILLGIKRLEEERDNMGCRTTGGASSYSFQPNLLKNHIVTQIIL